MTRPEKLVVAITGATGSIYGYRLLQVLAARDDVAVHLIVSRAGAMTAREELGIQTEDLKALADFVHPPGDIGASIASGSMTTAGMIIAPCSIRTLSNVATCNATTLIGRAADVTLKEGRPLILMVRETPLHLGHLRLMVQAAESGAVIAPPVPAFYTRPQTIAELVDHTVGRMLDRIGIGGGDIRRWYGLHGRKPRPDPDEHPGP